jgi:thioredoxin 1
MITKMETNNVRFRLFCFSLFLFASFVSAQTTRPQTQKALTTVNETWPGLASGSLTFATLGDLPENVLLKAGPLTITEKDLDEEINTVPLEKRPQYQKNAFFALEYFATPKLLLLAAGKPLSSNDKDSAAIIKARLDLAASHVTVSNKEIALYYKNNQDMFGEESLMDSRSQIASYLRKEKQRLAVQDYIRNLAKEIPVTLSAKWVAQEARFMLDNPVDNARKSGKPTLVNFSATGSQPSAAMQPILKSLKSNYTRKVNILIVQVRKDNILIARYGISGVPTQIFFDQNGAEVYRHEGFLPQKEIEDRLSRMGAK